MIHWKRRDDNDEPSHVEDVRGCLIAECEGEVIARQITCEHNAFPLLVEACKLQLVSLIQRFDENIGTESDYLPHWPAPHHHQAKRLRAALAAAEETI